MGISSTNTRTYTPEIAKWSSSIFISVGPKPTQTISSHISALVAEAELISPSIDSLRKESWRLLDCQWVYGEELELEREVVQISHQLNFYSIHDYTLHTSSSLVV
jgi:hypothetical protein